jgi:hypothetical protein
MTTHSSSGPSGAEHLRFPQWQGLYHAAVFETDRRKLLKRVQAAETAVLKRLETLPNLSEHLDERRAIFDAMGTLKFLRLDAKEEPPTSSRKLA